MKTDVDSLKATPSALESRSILREEKLPRVAVRILHLLRNPWAIVLIAFGFRLFTIFQHDLDNIPQSFGHMLFGYEMGRIASSLASGQGFSSPFPSWSGPTAWLGPMYPVLLAGVFKVFGIYTHASAVVIMVLNSAFSALTCVTIYMIATEIFSATVGVYSAWIWALAPYFVYWSAWIWETSLSTLLLTLAFLLTLRLDRQSRIRNWVLWGLVWGSLALSNASSLAFLPVAAAWLWYRAWRRGEQVVPKLALAGVVFAIAVAPWVARNYAAFGKFVFPRSDFGEELYMGNHEGSEGLCMFWDHPVWNSYEMESFQRQGELAYVAEKQKVAVDWIKQHPGRFAVLTLKRVGFFWFDIPEEGRMAVRFGIGSRHALFFGFALMSFWGLWIAFKRRERGAVLFAGLFLLYPLVYYITHSHPRYQHPITPEMLVLTVYLLVVSAQEPSRLLRGWRLPAVVSNKDAVTTASSCGEWT